MPTVDEVLREEGDRMGFSSPIPPNSHFAITLATRCATAENRLAEVERERDALLDQRDHWYEQFKNAADQITEMLDDEAKLVAERDALRVEVEALRARLEWLDVNLHLNPLIKINGKWMLWLNAATMHENLSDAVDAGIQRDVGIES